MTPVQTRTQSDPLEVERVIPAPRPKVYQAFTDPKQLTKFYAPDNMEADIREFDLRPGGLFHVRLHERNTEGDQGEQFMIGAFQEAVPDRRIVHSWSWKSDDPELRATSTVTVTLSDADEGTRVTIRHEGLPSPQQVEQHERGWDQILDRLAARF